MSDERPGYRLHVRPEPGVSDVTRNLRAWLKQGLRAHGLRCLQIEEIGMGKRKISVPTPESIDDVWQRRATAAAILAVREVVTGGSIPPATSISRLSDVELGWMVAAALFGWIKTRAEQATSEGWDTEETLRQTSLNPQPWDDGAIVSILPQLGALPDIDWSKPFGTWSRNEMTRFLIEALRLTHKAMIARDVGGSITTPSSKSLDEMQRVASAEVGGPLMTPDEFNDPLPF